MSTTIQWRNEFITELKDNEVFVFGSNATGFHGAGAAGLACRGEAKNTWRGDTWFRRAMRSTPDSPDRIGHWAIYGVARGLQAGRYGKSYAVQTIVQPGAKRSTSRREIYAQLQELWYFVDEHQEWTFLITPLGEGYAGWSRTEMNVVWEFLVEQHGLPSNVRFIGRAVGRDAT